MLPQENHKLIYPPQRTCQSRDKQPEHGSRGRFQRLREVGHAVIEVGGYFCVSLGINAEPLLLLDRLFQFGATLLKRHDSSAVNPQPPRKADELRLFHALRCVRKVKQYVFGIAYFPLRVFQTDAKRFEYLSAAPFTYSRHSNAGVKRRERGTEALSRTARTLDRFAPCADIFDILSYAFREFAKRVRFGQPRVKELSNRKSARERSGKRAENISYLTHAAAYVSFGLRHALLYALRVKAKCYNKRVNNSRHCRTPFIALLF